MQLSPNPTPYAYRRAAEPYIYIYIYIYVQPPGMQLRDSFPRVLLAGACALIGVMNEASRVAFVMIGLLCLAAGEG